MIIKLWLPERVGKVIDDGVVAGGGLVAHGPPAPHEVQPTLADQLVHHSAHCIEHTLGFYNIFIGTLLTLDSWSAKWNLHSHVLGADFWLTILYFYFFFL